MSFGKKLKKLRTDMGITQLQLSNVLDTAKSNISKYEADTIEPSISALCKLSKYFNVSADYLLDITDTKTPYSLAGRNVQTEFDNAPVLNYWISKTGMSCKEIADTAGISENLLDDYCSGVKQAPQSLIELLSDLCGVSTDCLLGFRKNSRTKLPDGEMPFRFDPEISRRLKEQAASMNEDYGQIASIIGIEESEVFNFFEYGFVPHITVFAKIVEHFLVSSDYLLNRSPSSLSVHADEEDLLCSYRALNSKSKTMALSRIYELEREESLVAAKDQYLDNAGKSSPSSGTGGNTMVG